MNPVLFSRLSSASEMLIKAWNPEFDCSRLVDLRNTGKTDYLYCNSTNGVTGNTIPGTNPNNPITSSDLSTGASVGIGVGVGVASLGIMAALAWFFIMCRRRCRKRNGATAAENRADDDKRDDPKEAAESVAGDGITPIREAGW
ncbi:hypothetical protein PG995_011749 [Apiospora arundinis]